MMGHRQVDQAALFYEFSLEYHIPTDHLLRAIDRFVELGELEAGAGAFYSWLGRPSIDPELIQIATVPINFRLGPGLQPADLSTAAAR
jgi:hypothetical protein